MQHLDAWRTRFHPILEELVEERIAEFRAKTKEPVLRSLLDHVKPLVLAGGKRIRPYLAAMVFEATGRSSEEVLRVLCGLELFHAFALVHDDIMDHGEMRHGVSTIHTYAAQGYAQSPRAAELGRNQAILIGDLLFAWAERCFGQIPSVPAEAADQARAYFSVMCEQVMLGQMLDVHATHEPFASMEDVIQKMSLKTAGYTFVHPLQIGAALGGAPVSWMEWAEAFGRPLGLAFQLQDDVLDICGEAAVLGKRPCMDVRDRQQTWVSEWMRRHAPDAWKTLHDTWWGRAFSVDEEAEVRALFERSGVLEAADEQARRWLEEAHMALTSAPFQGATRAPFQELLQKLTDRNT